jgi:DNA-binding NarL/FixJ family response regulator
VKPLCILLAVRPALFRDSLHVVLGRRKSLRVIEADCWGVEVLDIVRQYRVDVIVASFELTPEAPRLVVRLLSEFAGLTIVGIDPGGQAARIYSGGRAMRVVSCQTVSELIRAILGEE